MSDLRKWRGCPRGQEDTETAVCQRFREFPAFKDRAGLLTLGFPLGNICPTPWALLNTTPKGLVLSLALVTS